MTRRSPLNTLPACASFIPEDNVTLSDEITRLTGHINAAQHCFLRLLAALIERNAWEGAGMKSPAHWLNYFHGGDGRDDGGAESSEHCIGMHRHNQNSSPETLPVLQIKERS